MQILGLSGKKNVLRVVTEMLETVSQQWYWHRYTECKLAARTQNINTQAKLTLHTCKYKEMPSNCIAKKGKIG